MVCGNAHRFFPFAPTPALAAEVAIEVLAIADMSGIPAAAGRPPYPPRCIIAGLYIGMPPTAERGFGVGWGGGRGGGDIE